MKRRDPIHPKLYINLHRLKSNLFLSYQQNKFNNKGIRIIEYEKLPKNSEVGNFLLISKNIEQFEELKKYIIIQKRVLETYENVGNYHAGITIKNSIILLENFKDDFISWFNINN